MSSAIKQLENFAESEFRDISDVLASWRYTRSGASRNRARCSDEICRVNPFTHVVELIRFALYGQIEQASLAIVIGFAALFLAMAIYAYNPSKGLLGRRAEPGQGR